MRNTRGAGRQHISALGGGAERPMETIAFDSSNNEVDAAENHLEPKFPRD